MANAADAHVLHAVADMKTWTQLEGILILIRWSLQWSKRNRQMNLIGGTMRLRERTRRSNQYLFPSKSQSRIIQCREDILIEMLSSHTLSN